MNEGKKIVGKYLLWWKEYCSLQEGNRTNIEYKFDIILQKLITRLQESNVNSEELQKLYQYQKEYKTYDKEKLCQILSDIYIYGNSQAKKLCTNSHAMLNGDEIGKDIHWDDLIVYTPENDDKFYCFTITEVEDILQEHREVNPWTSEEWKISDVELNEKKDNTEKYLSKTRILKSGYQTELSQKRRDKIRNTFFQTKQRFNLQIPTILQAMNILNRFLYYEKITEIDLAVLVSLGIAIKIQQEDITLRLPDWIDVGVAILSKKFTKEQIISMEKMIVKTLDFDFFYKLDSHNVEKQFNNAMLSREYHQSFFLFGEKIFPKGKYITEGGEGIIYHTEGLCKMIGKVSLDNKDEGIPSGTLTEIFMLRYLEHPNIVQLKRVFFQKNNLVMYMKNCGESTADYVRRYGKGMETSLLKLTMKKLLEALKYIHSQGVIHRDVKPENLLMDKNNHITLIDFGMATQIYKKYMSSDVGTIWYRAPEILLGSQEYSTAVDIWACGCALVFLGCFQVLFIGYNNKDMLMEIYHLLGTPTWKENLPTFLPDWDGYEPKYKRLEARFSPQPTMATLKEKLGEEGIDLLKKMLIYNPEKRITAEEALKHPFFSDME